MRISIEHMEWYNFIDKYNNEWKEHLRYGQAFTTISTCSK